MLLQSRSLDTAANFLLSSAKAPTPTEVDSKPQTPREEEEEEEEKVEEGEEEEAVVVVMVEADHG